VCGDGTEFQTPGQCGRTVSRCRRASPTQRVRVSESCSRLVVVWAGIGLWSAARNERSPWRTDQGVVCLAALAGENGICRGERIAVVCPQRPLHGVSTRTPWSTLMTGA
jgi:hypothetical protein